MLLPWTHGQGPATLLWVWGTCLEAPRDLGQTSCAVTSGVGPAVLLSPRPLLASASSDSTPYPEDLVGPLRLRDRHRPAFRMPETHTNRTEIKGRKAMKSHKFHISPGRLPGGGRSQDSVFQKGAQQAFLEGERQGNRATVVNQVLSSLSLSLQFTAWSLCAWDPAK